MSAIAIEDDPSWTASMNVILDAIDNKKFDVRGCPDCDCNCKSPDLSCPKPRCGDVTCPQCNKGLIKKIIEPVAKNHKYVYGKYDCTEFSNEVVRRLEDIGFDAENKIVKMDCDEWDCSDTNLHEIVKVKEVYIEATGGWIIPPDQYEKYGIR